MPVTKTTSASASIAGKAPRRVLKATRADILAASGRTLVQFRYDQRKGAVDTSDLASVAAYIATHKKPALSTP